MRFPVFAAMLASLAASVLHAQPEDTIGVWRRVCNEGLCQVYLGLRNPETNETVATIAVVRDSTADKGSVFIELPIRVALPPGVTLTVGGLTEEIPYQFCCPEGCMAIAALTPELISALAEFGTADLSFVRYGKGSADSITVPVDGFAEAYDSLR